MERLYYTNNENVSYSGTRPIGINGVNIPFSRSDVLDRAFILDMIKQSLSSSDPDTLWNEVLNSVRRLVPEVLGHIFETLVLAIYASVRKDVRPQHRLADWIMFGEAISRALGNKDNEFVNAWMKNVQNQNQAAIDNNPLAQLMIGYVFETLAGKANAANSAKIGPLDTEPETLLQDLRIYAARRGIEYRKPMPQTSVWLTRNLVFISENLKQAGINLDMSRTHGRRYIRIELASSSSSSMSS